MNHPHRQNARQKQIKFSRAQKSVTGERFEDSVTSFRISERTMEKLFFIFHHFCTLTLLNKTKLRPNRLEVQKFLNVLQRKKKQIKLSDSRMNRCRLL